MIYQNIKKAIEEHLDKNDIELNTKQLKSLFSKELWAKHKTTRK